MFHVYELPVSSFTRVLSLFEPTWFDEQFIMPILGGQQPGRVIVDRLDQPGTAVLFRTYDFYIGGPPAASIRQFLKDTPAEVGAFQDFHGFAPLDPGWEPVLEQDFPDRLMKLKRCNYRWADAPVLDWRSALPDGVSIVPIDTALAQYLDQAWGEGIGFLWSGYERFAHQGFGFCLKVGNQIASMVVTDGVGAHSVNIGVRTADLFQRRGFARLVCSAFIERCLERGLLPVWDCEDRNTRSKRLAESLGFVQAKPFTEYCVSDPPYGKLTLSEDLWTSTPDSSVPGVTIWSRR